MRRYTLVKSRAAEEARRLFEAGEGDISSDEVLCELNALLKAAGEECCLLRHDQRGTVVFSMVEIQVVIDHDIHIFPRDTE